MISIDGVEYIPLNEYAEKAGIQCVTARQKCARGSLPSVKVGRSWFVRADTPEKVDKRITSGKCIGWRKKK